MSEQREPKRARQACLNCRRKKTRCSGEKPVCAFCARLGQECRYVESHLPDNATQSALHAGLADLAGQRANTGHEANLAARVALLESRLSLLGTTGFNTLLSALGDAPQQQPSNSSGSQEPYNDNSPESQASEPTKPFSTLPDLDVLQAAADVYFRHCHKQPYCYFREANFRRRLEEGSLPSYMLFAFMAMAARFSDHPFFQGRQAEAIDRYSRRAWSEIFEQSFSDDHTVNISTVQAANMLGIIDFVCGRHRLAWVKIGLAVRFAQSLRLGTEPEEGCSPTEKEERRWTFWSVYLLDKLVSCGRHRPPTLLDDDCTLRLPSNEPYFGQVDNPTLDRVNSIPDISPFRKGDNFGLTIFMASVLGRIVRYSFQHSSSGAFAPWDSRSEYTHIYGILLSFETYSDASGSFFPPALFSEYGPDGLIDYSLAGHFTFCHALYHLNQCLLHHPFLLRQRLKLQKINRVPPSFLREAVQRSRDHARHLTGVLDALQDIGCLAYPSFYGFCAIVAGVIHRLHAANTDNPDHRTAQEHLKSCTRFLDLNSSPWDHYTRISTALKSYEPTPSIATELLSSAFSANVLTPQEAEQLWNLTDYGWLSDSDRPTNLEMPDPDMDFGIEEWDEELGAGMRDETAGHKEFPISWDADHPADHGDVQAPLIDMMNVDRIMRGDFGTGTPIAQWSTTL